MTMDFGAMLQDYSDAVCKDQRVEKLLRALEVHIHDGSEVHDVVDRELRGLEHGVTAMNIKTAIEAKYQNCVPVDAIVEIVSKLVEPEELT